MLRNEVIKAGVPVFYVRRRSDNSNDYIHERVVAVAERLWSKTWHETAAVEGIRAAFEVVKGTHTKWQGVETVTQFRLMEN
jgi:hypothetical protein